MKSIQTISKVIARDLFTCHSAPNKRADHLDLVRKGVYLSSWCKRVVEARVFDILTRELARRPK